MSENVKLSHTAALILRTIDCGYRYGFDVMGCNRAAERDGLSGAPAVGAGRPGEGEVGG